MIRWLLMGAMSMAPALAAAQLRAAQDPNWPCQQIKVPEMSLASVWAGPALDPGDTSWRDNPDVSDLVAKVAPRREPLDQAQARIHEFAERAKDQKQPQLLQLMAGLFNVLNQDRDSVIAGLDRFGERQKDLAAGIRNDNEKLRELQSASSPDMKAVEQMTQQVTWQAEVFQDRRRSISYACEVPAKIEQRLFSLARQIQQELD